jgi:hypothetical protein
MIAPLEQPQPTEATRTVAAYGDQVAARRVALRDAWLAGALGFLCVMPYLAAPAGNNTAIQAGNLLTLGMVVPALVLSWRNKILWLFPLMLLPLFISAGKVAVTDGDLSLSFKSIFVWALSTLTIVATQLYAPRNSLAILTGLAAATVLHVIVGAWQWYAFSNGQFPLIELYSTNPSFLSVVDNARTMAKWEARPFGIFPEPSAMSCSLAPWVLFWTAHLCGIVKLRRQPAAWQNALFAVAAVGALSLIILSRSGHAAFTLAAACVFGAIWLVRSKATFRTYMALLTVFGLIMPIVLYLAAIALSDRMGGDKMGNSSWEDRSNSIIIGFHLLVGGGVGRVIFGVGPGLTTPILQGVYKLEAIWSVLLTYVYETGIVGLLVMGWLAGLLIRVWKTQRFDLAFAAIVAVWLVGATVTTSYDQLLSLWLTLGWLTVWPQICEPATTTLVPTAMAYRARVRPAAQPRGATAARHPADRGLSPALRRLGAGQPAAPQAQLPPPPRRWTDVENNE